MTPAGRLQAVIEALDLIRTDPRPADQVLHGFFRERRYIGGSDRRKVAALFWGVMRMRARLAADCALAEGSRPTDAQVRAEDGRRLVLAFCARERREGEADLALFGAGGYGPEAPTSGERDWLTALRRVKPSERPDWAWAECPQWLWPRFTEIAGDGLEAETRAARGEGPLDLRVNTLKTDREAARARLAAEGIASEPTPFSPLGLRCTGRPDVAGTKAFADGWVEVQDEGAQIVAMLVGAKPGETVADYCAGAGGKTLALAAAMENRGRLIAFDVAERRLDRSAQRLRRAGAFNVTRHTIAAGADKWIKRHKATFDRVLADAPCSGSGTWRRNPDARWRLTPAMLDNLARVQAEVLDGAARLVRPGGRLIYATCSLFPEENGARTAAFLDRRPDFRPVPVADLWPADVPSPSGLGDSPALTLTPGRHGCDGFFAAVLERTDAPPSQERIDTP